MICHRPLCLLIALLAAPLAATTASGQIDERLSITGGYEVYGGLTINGDPALLALRNRADVQLGFAPSGGRVMIRPRLTYDVRREELRADLREAFADIYLRNMDFRIGHQLIVWGRSDGVFITDLLAPLDLSEFLAQPFDDLRLGVTAIVGTVFLRDVELTGVVIPRRPTSRVPEPGSAWFPAPEAVFGVPIEVEEQVEPLATLRTAETAVRMTYRGLPRTDVSVLWINGFNRLPAFRKGIQVRLQPSFDARIVLSPAYERRQVIGFTGETLLLDPFILRTEVAYHTSHLLDQPIEVPSSAVEFQDPVFLAAASRGFLVERPFVQAALAVDRSFGLQNVSLQAIGRWVIDHDDRVAADAFEPGATILWLGRFRRETVTTRLFGLYNLGKDFWLNPEVSYNVQDGLNVAIGAQIFGGVGPDRADLTGLLREPGFRFSTFSDNDFGYLRLAYRF